MIDTSGIIDYIADDVKSFETVATSFAKSRFLALAVEFNTNEKEAEEISRIAEHVKCTINQDGSSFSLSTDFEEKTGNYFEIMNEGMDAPTLGGEGGGGIAKNPDGSTYRSNVPPQFWGQKVEALAEKGIDIVGEIKMMLTPLFREHIESAIQTAKPKITQFIKPYITQQLQGI